MSHQVPLLITLGDPNGLGPELACRCFAEPCEAVKHLVRSRPVLMIGPKSALMHHAQLLKIAPFWKDIQDVGELSFQQAGVYLFSPSELEPFPLEVGKATPEGGRAAGVSLQQACVLLQRKLAAGVVTLPLNKAMLQEAGFDFPGHTEFLAVRAGLKSDDVTMHLCGDKLRVSLVTTHPPLCDVPKLITQDRIMRALEQTAAFVRALDVENKTIAVCGLNPHAGESGHIGREEIDIIEPALAQARASGIDVAGPFPADTIFYRAVQGEFSAVLAMYHDQGLAPLKLLHFHNAVNVTLGLPFVRTSVDHGTGYDIAGRGVASLGSFELALELACVMVNKQP